MKAESETVGEAQAFFADPELLAAIQRGGVQGPPRIEFYE